MIAPESYEANPLSPLMARALRAALRALKAKELKLMAHIIIGAGIGGVPCAYELRKRLPAAEHRITLIGASERFDFTLSVN